MGETVLPLPEGSWTDRLTGAMASGPMSAAELFAELARGTVGAY